MEEFITAIKLLFFQYIYFSLYGMVGILLLTGIIPALVSPFEWLWRKLFGD